MQILTWVAATVLMATALASSGCAPTPPGPIAPLVVGSERYLTIQRQPEQRDQAVVVWGYVNNDSPYTFNGVRLLVDALGPDGQIISQRIVWALGVRVLVFSYDRIEGDGLGQRRVW